MKKEAIIQEIELSDDGSVKALKGKVQSVYEVTELQHEFMSHKFKRDTLNIIFWAQFEIFYMGG